MKPPLQLGLGIRYWRHGIAEADQAALLAEILTLAERAPFYRPTMPVSGKPLSVEMTNLGPLG